MTEETQNPNETEERQGEASELSAVLSGWISIDEKKPENNTPVLTYPGWATNDGISIDEWAGEYGCFLMCIEDGHKVTHWMPLPALPDR